MEEQIIKLNILTSIKNDNAVDGVTHRKQVTYFRGGLYIGDFWPGVHMEDLEVTGVRKR